LSSSTTVWSNVFDVSQEDEDDALYQVINHRSAIAHAGFMYPGTDIYALGTDETVSFYALQSQKEEEEEPTPKAFGDVREGLSCEYLVDMHWVGGQPFIAAGKHRYIQSKCIICARRHELTEMQHKSSKPRTNHQGHQRATLGLRLQP